MAIIKLNQLPDGSGTLSNDDIFVFMDDPTNSGSTKKITISQVSSLINNNDLQIPVLNLGSVSGVTNINFGPDRLYQTLTLNGAATTLTKGNGWPSGNFTSDVVLKLTINAPTTVIWSGVTDWYNQPAYTTAPSGDHLFLLRAVGPSVVEGHYIGNKTN